MKLKIYESLIPAQPVLWKTWRAFSWISTSFLFSIIKKLFSIHPSLDAPKQGIKAGKYFFPAKWRKLRMKCQVSHENFNEISFFPSRKLWRCTVVMNNSHFNKRNKTNEISYKHRSQISSIRAEINHNCRLIKKLFALEFPSARLTFQFFFYFLQ